MKPIWIVVANQAQARIYSADGPKLTGLNKIEDLTHLPSRQHEREITSDLPGKIKSVAAGGHAFESQTDPKKHEADVFAHRLTKHLETAYNSHVFSHLAIIAEPVFLGLLRRSLSEQLKKSICFELDKNLTHDNIGEIRFHISARLTG